MRRRREKAYFCRYIKWSWPAVRSVPTRLCLSLPPFSNILKTMVGKKQKIPRMYVHICWTVLRSRNWNPVDVISISPTELLVKPALLNSSRVSFETADMFCSDGKARYLRAIVGTLLNRNTSKCIPSVRWTFWKCWLFSSWHQSLMAEDQHIFELQSLRHAGTNGGNRSKTTDWVNKILTDVDDQIFTRVVSNLEIK